MKFIIQEPQEDQNFSLVYRDEDYSFDREPHDGTGFTSIMINDLQLEIDEEGKIIYVWGLCPLIKYEKINEYPTRYKAGSLVALLDELIQLNFQAMYKSPLEQQTHSKFQEAFPSGEANVYSAS